LGRCFPNRPSFLARPLRPQVSQCFQFCRELLDEFAKLETAEMWLDAILAAASDDVGWTLAELRSDNTAARLKTAGCFLARMRSSRLRFDR
jgi:hypothetical protein